LVIGSKPQSPTNYYVTNRSIPLISRPNEKWVFFFFLSQGASSGPIDRLYSANKQSPACFAALLWPEAWTRLRTAPGSDLKANPSTEQSWQPPGRPPLGCRGGCISCDQPLKVNRHRCVAGRYRRLCGEFEYSSPPRWLGSRACILLNPSSG